MKSVFSAGLILLMLSACGAPPFVPYDLSSKAEHQHSENEQAIKIQFAAEVNGAPFNCKQTYPKVGTTASTLTPKDFRFYISQIQLVNEAGQAVPLELEQDGKWQYKNLALLDFEDATGSCEGNPDTRSFVTGHVPAGKYKGLRFELGVPFELNHQDVNLAPSPLNLTSLFWVWRLGYKFTRLDFASTGQAQGYSIHLGSTGCGESTGNDAHVQHEDHETTASPVALNTAPEMCEAPNRASVQLPNFDAQTQQVSVDLGRLLADSNIDTNQADTPAGCMSGGDDQDCKGIFQHFGLSFAGQTSQQDFFSIK